MSEQILITLKRKFDDISVYGEIDPETRRNAFKEELQFYVLNFIYHHPEYSKWSMYGGSALRICYELDRMSIDLDFEIVRAITENFLDGLKKEIEEYFVNTYGVKSDFLTIKTITDRGLLLKFYVGEELDIGNASKQIHVKIDLNYFITPKIVIERIPINHNQFSFVIITYNMSALMASKIAAIFLRGTRGVGEAVYGEKGRDIYDLLWYMNKKVVPDLDYLKAKDVEEAEDLRTLFDKLTIKMNEVSDENLKQDLSPLFINRTYIENWLKNWRENYLRLIKEYKMNIVKELREIMIQKDIRAGVYYFGYFYKIESGGTAVVRYALSEYGIDFRDRDLPIKINDKIIKLVTDDMKGEKLNQYTMLFYEKTEKYFKKTNRIIFGNTIITKFIRMTADDFNQKEEVVLTKSALLSCELEDLLK